MRALLPLRAQSEKSLEGWHLWMVVITVSLPFVLYHIVEAWRVARGVAFRHHVDGVRASRVAEAAQAQRDAEERLRAIADASGKDHTHVVEVAPEPQEAVGPLPAADERVEIRVAAQLSLRAFLEAWQRTREACARKREVLSRYDREIERLSALRRDEQPMLSPESIQRIDASYAAVVRAVQEFDETVQRDSRYLEKKLPPRLIERIRSLHGRQPRGEMLDGNPADADRSSKGAQSPPR